MDGAPETCAKVLTHLVKETRVSGGLEIGGNVPKYTPERAKEMAGWYFQGLKDSWPDRKSDFWRKEVKYCIAQIRKFWAIALPGEKFYASDL